MSNGLLCFRAAAAQGVQHDAGTWHHPLLVLVPEQDFLVVDRQGPGDNLEEIELEATARIVTGSQRPLSRRFPSLPLRHIADPDK